MSNSADHLSLHGDLGRNKIGFLSAMSKSLERKGKSQSWVAKRGSSAPMWDLIDATDERK